MSAVQRTRNAQYYQNYGYSLASLKFFDPNQAVRIKSLQHLEQITNLCEKIHLTPHTYQEHPLDVKLKFLQAYQYSMLYSINLKLLSDAKQSEFQNRNNQLKASIQLKKKTIKQHKKKVQKRKLQYKDMKMNRFKKVFKILQKQIEVQNCLKIQQLKTKQEQITLIKTRFEKQVQAGRNYLLQNKYSNVSPHPTSNQFFIGQSPQEYPPYQQNRQQKYQVNQLTPNWHPNYLNQQQNPSNWPRNYLNQHKNPSNQNHQQKNQQQQRALPNNSGGIVNPLKILQDKKLFSNVGKGDGNFYEKGKEQQINSQTIFDEQNKRQELQNLEKQKKQSDILNKNKPENNLIKQLSFGSNKYVDLNQTNQSVKHISSIQQRKVGENQESNQLKKSKNTVKNLEQKLTITDPQQISNYQTSTINSGMGNKTKTSTGKLFDKNNLKKKYQKQSYNIISPSKTDPLFQKPQDFRASIDDDKQYDIFQSANGHQEISINLNLFNQPKRRNFQTESHSTSQSNKKFKSQDLRAIHQSNEEENNPFDDLQMGLNTNKSKISKLNHKNKNKNQNQSTPAPPPIGKQLNIDQDQAEYFNEDFENSQSANLNNTSLTKLESNKNIPKKYENSEVKLQNPSSNSSFNDQDNQGGIFPDLNEQKFQVKQNNISKNQNYLQFTEGIFIPYQEDNLSCKVTSSIMKRSRIEKRNQGEESDNLDQSFGDLKMSLNSKINKKKKNLITTSKIKQNHYNIKVNSSNTNKTIISKTFQIANSDQRSLLLLKEGSLVSIQSQTQEKNQRKGLGYLNLTKSETYDDNYSLKQESKNKNLNPKKNQLLNFQNLISRSNPYQNKPQQVQQNSKNYSSKLKEPGERLPPSLMSSNSNHQESKISEKKQSNPSNQNQEIESIQQDFHLSLQNDSSKISQSQKQDLQKKMVQIMRNKYKHQRIESIAQKAKVDQDINKEINNLLKNPSQSQNLTVKNCKLIQKQFQLKTKTIKNSQNSNSRAVEKKLIQIQSKEIKKSVKEESRENNKIKLELTQKSSLSDEESAELQYSRSIIAKNLNKKNLNIKVPANQNQSDFELLCQIENKKQVEDDNRIRHSSNQKSQIVNKSSQIYKSDQISKSKISETDDFNIPDLWLQSNFHLTKKKIQDNSKKIDLVSANEDKIIAKNDGIKSKYVKTVQSAKSISKQSASTRLQQQKYLTLEDPLNNLISKAKNLSNNNIQADNEDSFDS